MVPIMMAIIAGMITIIGVLVVILVGVEVVVPFYQAKGGTAGAELGVTANEAVGMEMIFAFGGAMVIAVPVGIGLYLYMGNDSRKGRYRRREPPRQRK
jgi:hypothetical protein